MSTLLDLWIKWWNVNMISIFKSRFMMEVLVLKDLTQQTLWGHIYLELLIGLISNIFNLFIRCCKSESQSYPCMALNHFQGIGKGENVYAEMLCLSDHTFEVKIKCWLESSWRALAGGKLSLQLNLIRGIILYGYSIFIKYVPDKTFFLFPVLWMAS